MTAEEEIRSEIASGGLLVTPKKRGFAAISPEKQREIASKGGKAVQAQGKGHQFNSETGKAARAKRKNNESKA